MTAGRRTRLAFVPRGRSARQGGEHFGGPGARLARAGRTADRGQIAPGVATQPHTIHRTPDRSAGPATARGRAQAYDAGAYPPGRERARAGQSSLEPRPSAEPASGACLRACRRPGQRTGPPARGAHAPSAGVGSRDTVSAATEPCRRRPAPRGEVVGRTRRPSERPNGRLASRARDERSSFGEGPLPRTRACRPVLGGWSMKGELLRSHHAERVDHQRERAREESRDH